MSILLFNISKNEDPWEPVPVLNNPHHEKVFPDVQRKHPVCSHYLWCCYWALWRTLPILFDILFKYLCTLMGSSWAFFSPDWAVTAPWAFPHQRGASVPFIVFVALCRTIGQQSDFIVRPFNNLWIIMTIRRSVQELKERRCHFWIKTRT